MFRLIAKNSAIYGIIPQLPKVASFFVLPFITPFLTSFDYGLIGILNVYIGLLNGIHFLGLNVVISNAFIRHPYHYKILWRQIYGFIICWSVFYSILVGFIIYIVLPAEAVENRTQIILIKTIPQFIFAPTTLMMTAYYRLEQKAWPIASRSLIAGLFGIGLNLYFIASLKLGYMGWIYSELLTSLLSGLFFFVPAYLGLKLFPIFNFKWRLIKKSLKVGLPVVPHNYSHYLINSSDRLVMERLNVPTGEIGVYSLAYTIGSYFNILANSLNQAIGPNLLYFAKEKKWGDYTNLIFVFQGFIFLACFTAAIWINEWVPFLVRNDELLTHIELFVIILLSYSAWPMYVGCNQVLFYFEKTNVLWKITTVAGIINVVLNLIFIPVFGFVFAAYSTFLTLLFQGFTGFLYKHFRENNGAQLYPVLWLTLIVISLPVALIIKDQSIILKLFFTILPASFILMYYFKRISNKPPKELFPNLIKRKNQKKK